MLTGIYANAHFKKNCDAVQHCLLKRRFNCSHGLRSGGGAWAAAFLGIELADTNRRNQKHFLGITLFLLSTAHPCSWAVQTASVAVSERCRSITCLCHPWQMWPDLMLCCSSNPALKTLQVPDHLHAREVLTNQSSFERRQAWSNINKANVLGGWVPLWVTAERKILQVVHYRMMKFSYFLPSFFPSASQLLSSKAKLRDPKAAVCPKHQLRLTELFSYVQFTGKEQMENENVKVHPKSLPETITFSWTHFSLVGKKRVSRQMRAGKAFQSNPPSDQVQRQQNWVIHAGIQELSAPAGWAKSSLGKASKLTVKSSPEQMERESDIIRHNIFGFLQWQHFSAIHKFNLVCCGICPVDGRFP